MDALVSILQSLEETYAQLEKHRRERAGKEHHNSCKLQVIIFENLIKKKKAQIEAFGRGEIKKVSGQVKQEKDRFTFIKHFEIQYLNCTDAEVELLLGRDIPGEIIQFKIETSATRRVHYTI